MGLEENQANCQQNIGMETEQAFEASNDFSMIPPEDALDGSLFGANPEDAFDGGFFGVNPEVPLNEGFSDANPEYIQTGNLLFEQHVSAQLPLTLDDFYSHLPDSREGSSTLANGSAGPIATYPSFSQFATHQDPLVTAKSRFVPTNASGFIRMNARVEDLFIPEPSDEPCDLALSPTQPQPPPSSPEHHPIPCVRENCHICQIFSLPY